MFSTFLLSGCLLCSHLACSNPTTGSKRDDFRDDACGELAYGASIEADALAQDLIIYSQIVADDFARNGSPRLSSEGFDPTLIRVPEVSLDGTISEPGYGQTVIGYFVSDDGTEEQPESRFAYLNALRSTRQLGGDSFDVYIPYIAELAATHCHNLLNQNWPVGTSFTDLERTTLCAIPGYVEKINLRRLVNALYVKSAMLNLPLTIAEASILDDYAQFQYARLAILGTNGHFSPVAQQLGGFAYQEMESYLPDFEAPTAIDMLIAGYDRDLIAVDEGSDCEMAYIAPGSASGAIVYSFDPIYFLLTAGVTRVFDISATTLREAALELVRRFPTGLAGETVSTAGRNALTEIVLHFRRELANFLAKVVKNTINSVVRTSISRALKETLSKLPANVSTEARDLIDKLVAATTADEIEAVLAAAGQDSIVASNDYGWTIDLGNGKIVTINASAQARVAKVEVGGDEGEFALNRRLARLNRLAENGYRTVEATSPVQIVTAGVDSLTFAYFNKPAGLMRPALLSELETHAVSESALDGFVEQHIGGAIKTVLEREDFDFDVSSMQFSYDGSVSELAVLVKDPASGDPAAVLKSNLVVVDF